MGEILFLCGNNKRAVIATLSILDNGIQRPKGISEDEVTWIYCWYWWFDQHLIGNRLNWNSNLFITVSFCGSFKIIWFPDSNLAQLNKQVISKALEGLCIESATDLQKILRVETYTSQESAMQRLEGLIPVFRSRMGALLFLISALLSRGLVCSTTIYAALHLQVL